MENIQKIHELLLQVISEAEASVEEMESDDYSLEEFEWNQQYQDGVMSGATKLFKKIEILLAEQN